jgi:hypothetical protein
MACQTVVSDEGKSVCRESPCYDDYRDDCCCGTDSGVC